MNQSPQPLHEEESRILAEQVKLLFGAMPLAIAATLINALILVAVQWNVLDHDSLLTWLAIMLATLLLRGALTFGYRRSAPDAEASRTWAIWFIAGATATALTWGATSVWLFPADVGHQVFLAFVMAGMSAGASTSLSFLRTPIILFLIILLLPLGIRFFQLGDDLSLAMGGMTLLFLVMVMVSSLKIHHNTRQNIALRLEAATREDRLRISEGKYHHIFDSAPLGIAHFDQRGRLTDFNDTFASMLASDSVGLRNLNLLQDTTDPKLQDAVRQALAGLTARFEGSSTAFVSGRELDIRVFCGGIESREGVIEGGVIIVVDVSEDKRMEKLKSEFISTVSHELRTPLTAVQGAVGLLHGKVMGDLPDKAHDLLEIAQHNTQRLLLLINDILDIDRITSGAAGLDLRPVDLWAFLEQAARISHSYAHQFGVELRIDCEPREDIHVNADPTRLMQIVTNLLSNACKFSSPGAIVEIGARAEEDQAIISVRDHGPGIPENFRQYIYDRFSQADATDSRRVGGTGLGLSITRALVEQHGGRIRFDTGPEGTTFFVELPRLAEARPL